MVVWLNLVMFCPPRWEVGGPGVPGAASANWSGSALWSKSVVRKEAMQMQRAAGRHTNVAYRCMNATVAAAGGGGISRAQRNISSIGSKLCRKRAPDREYHFFTANSSQVHHTGYRPFETCKKTDESSVTILSAVVSFSEVDNNQNKYAEQ